MLGSKVEIPDGAARTFHARRNPAKTVTEIYTTVVGSSQIINFWLHLIIIISWPPCATLKINKTKWFLAWNILLSYNYSLVVTWIPALHLPFSMNGEAWQKYYVWQEREVSPSPVTEIAHFPPLPHNCTFTLYLCQIPTHILIFLIVTSLHEFTLK